MDLINQAIKYVNVACKRLCIIDDDFCTAMLPRLERKEFICSLMLNQSLTLTNLIKSVMVLRAWTSI